MEAFVTRLATLFRVSYRFPRRLALLAASLLWLFAATLAAVAAPAPDTTQSRARLDQALQRYEAARRNAEALDARARAASTRLDDVIAHEREAQQSLDRQANAMYRGVDGQLAWLLEAGSIQELSTRWDFLVRVASEDARTVERLKRLRAEASATARSLIALQAQQARSTAAMQSDVARAKSDLAEDEAALAAYRARIAQSRPAPQPAVVAKRQPPAPRTLRGPQGTGAWRSATASNYGLNFTGRGANGEAIGPYSMIVAHRTLPFGTLIEFEYRGKHAVAKVADRGPYVAGREFDLGPGVARVLDFSGVDTVRYRIIGK